MHCIVNAVLLGKHTWRHLQANAIKKSIFTSSFREGSAGIEDGLCSAAQRCPIAIFGKRNYNMQV